VFCVVQLEIKPFNSLWNNNKTFLANNSNMARCRQLSVYPIETGSTNDVIFHDVTTPAGSWPYVGAIAYNVT